MSIPQVPLDDVEPNPFQTRQTHLVGVAKTLGVRLPADWTKRAAALEPKTSAVSTETDEDEEA